METLSWCVDCATCTDAGGLKFEGPSPKTETSSPQRGHEYPRIVHLRPKVKSSNDLVFQNDRLLFIQSAKVQISLCLNVELSVPQPLNNKLVALCALVNVLDVVCAMSVKIL